ncbi:MAG: ABC transporter permease [Saprospiraceae bacterium]|nr:ABC transporter permease [Saprospiraceae bacterium]
MKERTVITSDGLSLWSYLKELVRFKQLLWAFSYRNLRAKYAQTLAGVLWVLINPLVSLLILGFVFGKVAKMDTNGVDPFLFTSVGLAAWTYISTVATWSGTSIVNAQGMITKIYFPRLLLPLSTAVIGLIDFAVVTVLVIILFAVDGSTPSSNLIFLPLFIVAILLGGIATGIWIAGLCVRYRDFLHVVPFILRIGLYASPVAYAVSAVDEQYRWLYLFNPLTGLLEGLRWCFFGGHFPKAEFLVFGLVLIISLMTGLVYFTRVEKNIADII